MNEALRKDLCMSGFMATEELVITMVNTARAHGSLEEQMQTLMKMVNSMVDFWTWGK